MGELIMPKQTSDPAKFYATLSILYKAYKDGNPIVSNSEYKRQIINMFDNYSNDSNGAMIVKQSEMARYFGFAYRDFDNREMSITETGIEMFEAHENEDRQTEHRLIAQAIINLSFGRRNTAIKSSDSDIDAPKLLVKSIIALNGITNVELAYLISLTNDYQLDFDSAVNEILNVREDEHTIVIPEENVNKYYDNKFGAFLVAMEFCFRDTDKRYQLSNSVLEYYGGDFENLSIYNTTPDITYSTNEDIYPTDEETDQSETYKKRVSTTVGYDVESDYFERQNRRAPKQSITKAGKRGYTTNPRIAKTALELADYKCEFDNEHLTFIGKSGNAFMEMHYLIPMAAQGDFENNLDCIENIISLCPNCHSGIHYGNEAWRKTFLQSLYLKREDALRKAGIYISFDILFEKYYK